MSSLLQYLPLSLAVRALMRMRGLAELKAIDISSKVQIHTLGELHGRFNTVIANCSLEHVPSLDNSLANIRRLLKDTDSVFYLFVPAPDWTDWLAVKRFVRRFSPRLAG